MLRGPHPGRVYELSGDVMMLGRGRRNDIVILDDNEVSREHCRFTRTEEGYYELEDLHSSNGTFVNGQRVDIDGLILRGKAIVELGDTITFQYIPAGEEEEDFEDDAAQDMPEASSMQPFLIVHLASQQEPEVYPLDGLVINAGRDLDNDIVIQEPEVSRHHFRLSFSNAGYTLEDLGSLNGVSVNGEHLDEPRVLRPNDSIEIGTMVRMQYTNEPGRYQTPISTEILPVQPGTNETNPKISTTSTQAKQLDFEDEHPTIGSITSLGGSPLKIMEDPPTGTDVGHGLEPGELEGHIFIAYAQRDWSNVVARLFTMLHDEGLEAWVDQYLTPNGDDWKLAIEQAMAECDLLVVVVSRAALNTPYVQRSIPRFRNRAKQVVLLMYEHVERLPISCKGLPRIRYDPENPEHSLRRLVMAIKRGKV